MIRPRRISSLLPCAVGVAAVILPFAPPAQEIDNRPVYYLMVKSLEDGFQDYNTALAKELRARESAIRNRHEAEREDIARQIAALEAERSRREEAFNAERESLNRRIDAINERIIARDGRLHEERRLQKLHAPRFANDPRIKELKEGVAARLAELETMRKRYLEQLEATRKARAALTRQFEEYMNAGDPLALEIRALDEEWQRFAEKERRKLKALADAYAVDYAAYEKWLEGERATLKEMRAGIARALEADRTERARHAETESELARLIDEYNALVEVHSAAPPDDPERDARALEFARLEKRIAELQAELADARDAVLAIHEELEHANDEYQARYERFIAEKRGRDRELAADLAELNASRNDIESIIAARREKVDAQIRSLEAHISGELRDSRSDLERLNAAMTGAYGRDHEGLGAAITRVLESNDDGLLYTAAGTARYDLSRPRTAGVYTAVERLGADRRRIDARIAAIEKSEGDARPAASGETEAGGALEQERAALSVERQRLLEAFATFARETQTRARALEERLSAVDARFAQARARLGELYSARAEATSAEMQAVQAVLVAAVKGLPGKEPARGEHRRLMALLEERARRMGEPADSALLAPHALMDHLRSLRPHPQARATDAAWRTFGASKVTASRELAGEDKATLAAAWFARLRAQPGVASVAEALEESEAVADGERALGTLFVAGVMDHAGILEHTLDGGGTGVQVNILGRAYQLDSTGSLARLPSG